MENNVKRIQLIQDRIEEIRKQHLKLTQKEFADRIGCTLNVYKNNVNHSKTPMNIETSGFLNKISYNTGISLAYLHLETDEMYERIPGSPDTPIAFDLHHQKVTELSKHLSTMDNDELLNALLFLLCKLPYEYSSTYKAMIISTYKAASQLSFQINPDLLNDASFKIITNNLRTRNMWAFKQSLMECEADEHLSKKRFRSALQTYIESLLISANDYNEIDRTLPIRHITFSLPEERQIGEKIYHLLNHWPQYKEKNLADYEEEVISAVLNHFS